MTADRHTLIGMGFAQGHVARALVATKNAGLQPALDWLVNNPDTGEEVAAPATGFSLGGSGTSASADVGTFNAPSVSGVAAAATHDATAPVDAETATDPGANSLKCDDCGRMLRDTTAAQAHATRTGHQNFSQSTEVIKPLSEEEKKQKLEELRQRLAEKRAEKQQREIQESKEREAMRRISGKDISKAKELAAEQEMKRALEQKKREKKEEAEARARIKAQIEEDRKARAEKTEMEKRMRSGEVPAVAVTATPTPAPQNFDETRIQFRSMSGGAPLMHTFRADDTLQSVFDFLRGQHLVIGALATTFPRKEYAATASEETKKTLKELGMVPSVVLLMK